MHFGRRAATALTVGNNIRLEASAKASGGGHWFPIVQIVTDKATVASEAVNGTCNAGQAVVGMASTTGFAAGDLVYIDNGTIALSEWHRIKSVVTNTSVTLEENLVNAQTGATVYGGAQILTLGPIDVSAYKRLRIVMDAVPGGQAVAIEAQAITCDSLG